ncbi:DUF4296 domain-containing protein [Hymenobacter sediminis]|uniref:DUF4296 domain-containing protein n=1 Tax=Hymenobacter sediminis TaxID=2218621 RepID=UPI000F4EE20C|nr:DUF4296 domain-containing protein [Hymenobacter sediminis]RPD47758.1 DUF4296 domain-containing protein [Hymenobacter sediminis]
MKRFSFRVTMWIGALALLVTACQKNDEVTPPQQLIPRDKMVSLLVELHTLEARADAAGLPTDSSRALFLQARKGLYSRFAVDDSSFVRSYRYYAIHEKDLDQIYAVVVDSLALREARLQTAHDAASTVPATPPSPTPPRRR